MLRDADVANALAPRLEGLASLVVLWVLPVNVPRLLGGVALLNGDTDDARAHYEQSVASCERVRFRFELALSRLALAELLLDHYPGEREEALRHLDAAIADLRDMKMQPALERALARREGLG